MAQNFFEKNPKVVLAVINLFFIVLVAVILNLQIFQDVPNSPKYSIYNQIEYNLRCGGKRNIVLRENTPNSNQTRVPPYDLKQKYNFSVDENGFIKPSKIHAKSDLNIFFLGGSTTECEYVDEPYRFPYLVGRILEEKTGKKINSYNAGKSGNNSIHSINNLLNKIVPLHPDIVVRMETINDLSTLLYEATYWNKNRSRSNLACFDKSYSSLRNFKNEWELSPYRNMILDRDHQRVIKEEYRKILTLFVAITKAIGAKPVLMTQVNKIIDYPDFEVKKGDDEFNKTYRRLYSDLQNITREVAYQNNVLLIDLVRDLPQAKEYLYDSVHYKNDGSKIVAQFIAKKLEPLARK